MESFEGRLAVVTGGGSGMGRELVIQLAAEGCSVATCDVNAEAIAETALRAEKEAPTGARITAHLCDVSKEGDGESGVLGRKSLDVVAGPQSEATR